MSELIKNPSKLHWLVFIGFIISWICRCTFVVIIPDVTFSCLFLQENETIEFKRLKIVNIRLFLVLQRIN